MITIIAKIKEPDNTKCCRECGTHNTLVTVIKDGQMCNYFHYQFVCVCVCVCTRSVKSDSVTPWTGALQAPLSMEFSR